MMSDDPSSGASWIEDRENLRAGHTLPSTASACSHGPAQADVWTIGEALAVVQSTFGCEGGRNFTSSHAIRGHEKCKSRRGGGEEEVGDLVPPERTSLNPVRRRRL